MEDLKSCSVCGVPFSVSKEQTWQENGVIKQTKDFEHRMLFYECDNLDVLFGGIEEIIGVSIERIIIESKRKEVKEYIEKLLPSVARKAAKHLGTKMMISKIADMGKSYGYGITTLVEKNKGKGSDNFITTEVKNPFSVPFLCGETLGAWEAIDGREHQVEKMEINPNTYRITCRVGNHPIELKDRLEQKKYPEKSSRVGFKRCQSCAIPIDVARYRWRTDEGIIVDPESGIRMAIFGPVGLEAIFNDLETELGGIVPEAVIEAQKEFTRKYAKNRSWKLDENTFRSMIALRGLGYLREMKLSRNVLEIRIENSCINLIMVGLLKGIYEIVAGKISSHAEWESREDGDLLIRVTPAR